MFRRKCITPTGSVGYHGRSSSIVPSEFRFTDQWDKHYQMEKLHRFWTFTFCRLETAFITTDVNIMGENMAVTEAEDYILNGFIE
jgi:fumarylacetoacetase